MKSKFVIGAFALMLTCGVSACGNQPVSPSVESVSEQGMTDENGNTYVIEKMFNPNELPSDENGGLYTGFVNEAGLPNGYGKMEYNTSTVYEGYWEEGKWRGICKINWDSGCVYQGEAKDSLMHGKGYMKWTMGDYYYGQWKMGSPNGFGTKYYFIDGTKEHDLDAYNIYTGEFVDNLKVGKGTMHYAFGAVYSGEWVNDKRSGYGVQYWEPGCHEIRFEGEFFDDWIDGYGTMYYDDGTFLTGQWHGTEYAGE